MRAANHFLLLCAALLLYPSAQVRAEEPLWGEIASTLGEGFANVSTRGTLQAFRAFNHHGGAVALTVEQMRGGFSVEYGLQPDLDLRVSVPYFSQTMEEQYAGQTVRHQISGVGETLVGAKWRFWQRMNARRKDELAVCTDLKLPTGDSDLRDPSGAIIPAHLQPNSGNPGMRLGLAANRHTSWGGHWFSVMIAGETPSSRYQRGTMLEIHASTGRRTRRLTRPGQTDWMGIIGLHYHRMGQERENGRLVSDSGGSILSAEISLLGSRQTRGLRLGVLLPIRTNLGLAHPPPSHEIQASFRGSF